MAVSFHGRLKIIGNFNSRSFMLAVTLVNNEVVRSSLVPLRAGDRIQAFNTIAQGSVIQTVTIDLENRSGVGFVQKGAGLTAWTSYFREQTAVMVEREGEPPMQGSLIHPVDNIGRQSLWGFASFDGSGDVVFQNGDKVTMYRFVTEGDIVMDMVVQAGDEEQMAMLNDAQARGYPVKLTRNYVPQ